MDLFGTLITAVSRLSDHLRRMDEGVFYAVDDLAVTLRLLTYRGRRFESGQLKGGQGAHLIQRAVERFDLEMPKILCTGIATHKAMFSVGAIPLAARHIGGIANIRFCRLHLDDWLDLPVIHIRGAEDTPITWTHFMSSYANKYGGAHADEVIPTWLKRLDYNGVGDLSMSGYLLYQAGEATWHAAQEVIRAIYNKFNADDPQSEDWNMTIAGGRTDPPRSRDELGHLEHFIENDTQVSFTWLVDDESDKNRLRLYFEDAPWDFVCNSSGETDMRHSTNPSHEFIFQMPMNPRYPLKSLTPFREAPEKTLFVRQIPYSKLDYESFPTSIEEMVERGFTVLADGSSENVQGWQVVDRGSYK